MSTIKSVEQTLKALEILGTQNFRFRRLGLELPLLFTDLADLDDRDDVTLALSSSIETDIGRGMLASPSWWPS